MTRKFLVMLRTEPIRKRSTLGKAASLACFLSFAAYIVCSNVLHNAVAGLSYHLALARMFFSKPTVPLPERLVLTNFAPLFAFIALCVIGGVLASRITGNRDRLAAALVFGLALAVVPTMVLASCYWPDGRGHLTTRNILAGTFIVDGALALILLRMGARREVSTNNKSTVKSPKTGSRGWAITLACVTGVTLISALLNGLADPIKAHDTTAYHLPLAASLLKYSSLPTQNNPQLFYPANGELIQRWALSVGTDRIVCLVSWFMVLICFYAVYALCIAMGQHRSTAVIAGTSAIVAPPVMYLAAIAYVNLFMTACVLFAILFLLRWWQSGMNSFRDILVFGAAAGLAAGSKYSVLPSLLAVGAVWLFICIAGLVAYDGRSPRGPTSINHSLRIVFMILLAAGSCFLCGGFWYVRNLAATGNPIYPIAMLGMKGVPFAQFVPPSLANPSLRWLAFVWTEVADCNFDTGFGMAFAVIALPAVVLYPWTRRVRSNSKGSLMLYHLLLAFWAAFVMSGVLDGRYAMVPLVLSFVLFGELWESIPEIPFRAVTTAAAVLAATISFEALIAGSMYSCVMGFPKLRGAVRCGVPAEIDHLPPSTIFDAAGQNYIYGLMGVDCRHNVVVLPGIPTPEKVLGQHADYVLLHRSQVAEFTAKMSIKQVATYPANGQAVVSLWKIEGHNTVPSDKRK